MTTPESNAAPPAPRLFSPLQLGPLTLPNRIVIAPMCQYSAIDGVAQDWHLMHLGQMATSGAGLLIIEATGVTPEGRITPGCLGLYDDATEAALGNIVRAIRKHSDMPLAIQLGHAGRKASSHAPWHGGMLIPIDEGGWPTLAPSALEHLPGERLPQALDDAGLQRLLDAFADAARRAHRIGLQALELHAAHGYLLHQFLSPVANQRDDRWGGSAERRMAFPLAVFDAVRAAVPASVAVGVRISATDWLDHLPVERWDVPQSVAFGQALKARGADFIHVSSGGVSPKQKIPIGPGYQVPLAEQIKAGCGLPTIAVGLITEPEQAETVLADGRADAVALARGMLYNPRWPWHAAARLGAQVKAPEQYWRCPPASAGRVFGDTKIGMR